MIFKNVPQYQVDQLLSGLGALNPKFHARPWGPGELHCPVWRVALFSIKNKRIFQEISYTVWNMPLILSHPPSLLGQCPKFVRIFFLMASLIYFA